MTQLPTQNLIFSRAKGNTSAPPLNDLSEDVIQTRDIIAPQIPGFPLQVNTRFSADVLIPKPTGKEITVPTDKVVVVGASTGGPEAVQRFLEALPPNAPGIVVVQHMPKEYTSIFANRLDGLCRIRVKEAEDGEIVTRGKALIAPGNSHILLKRKGARYHIELKGGPLVGHHRPSVDVLFRSAALCAGQNTVAAIMTGMGSDGAQGMIELKECGATTIAQNEESCVVFGMPKKAIKLGGVDKVLPLNQITEEVLRLT